jgi:small-conductance mechanosensitive channel
VNGVSAWVERVAGLSPRVQGDLAASAVLVLVVWSLRLLVLRLARRQLAAGARQAYRWRKTSTYLASVLTLLGLGRIWIAGFQSVTTFLGLLSAGLAIALKDPLVNLAGWLFILGRRPFEVGDRIQIGALAGDVVDLRVLQFTVLEIGNWVDADQSTGRVVHVPNGRVFTENQANCDKGFRYIWNELPVLVTFESDWRRAKALLQQVVARQTADVVHQAQRHVEAAARRLLIHYTHLTPIVYTAVRDCGVLLTVRYLCEPRHRRDSEEKLWEAILDVFAAEAAIDFAYPTQRFYDNRTEGKGAPAAGAPRRGETGVRP